MARPGVCKTKSLRDLLHSVEGWTVRKIVNTMTMSCLSCLLPELCPTHAVGEGPSWTQPQPEPLPGRSLLQPESYGWGCSLGGTGAAADPDKV